MSVEILRWSVVPILNVHQVRFRFSLPSRLVFLAPEAASSCPSDTNSKKLGSPNPARFSPARLGESAGLHNLTAKDVHLRRIQRLHGRSRTTLLFADEKQRSPTEASYNCQSKRQGWHPAPQCGRHARTGMNEGGLKLLRSFEKLHRSFKTLGSGCL